ncbi:MAG: OsmC family protein [Elusimicrobia bacterium]|nr:OsmC family protein [Elusimicrobiota bacterium]
MEMRIRFPGNKKVSAEFDGLRIVTDQPKEAGGDGAGPAPFDLFLASIGTCAGIFALSFCRKRGIDTEGLELVETIDWDETAHRAWKITLDVRLPPGFPEKYRDALANAINLCTVKKHLADPPTILVRCGQSSPSAR